MAWDCAGGGGAGRVSGVFGEGRRRAGEERRGRAYVGSCG